MPTIYQPTPLDCVRIKREVMVMDHDLNQLYYPLKEEGLQTYQLQDVGESSDNHVHKDHMEIVKNLQRGISQIGSTTPNPKEGTYEMHILGCQGSAD